MSAVCSRCTLLCCAVLCFGCLIAGLAGCANQESAKAEGEDKPANQAPAESAEKITDPKAQLQADLDDAISLLEKGDLEVFIDRYVPVKELRSLREQGKRDAVLKTLKAGGQFQKEWLLRLRALRKGEIEFVDADKSLAKITGDTGAAGLSKFSLANPADEKVPSYDGFPGDVKAAIGKAIEALEKKDYRTFVENFYPESELQSATSKEGMQALEIRLKAYPEMVQQMIADLKALQKQTPQFDEQQTTATFELKFEPKKGKTIKRTIRFAKAGTWRMADTAKEIRTKMYKQSLKPSVGAKEELTTKWERIRDHWRLYDTD